MKFKSKKRSVGDKHFYIYIKIDDDSDDDSNGGLKIKKLLRNPITYEINGTVFRNTYLAGGVDLKYPEAFHTYFIAIYDTELKKFIVTGYKSKLHAATWTIPRLNDLVVIDNGQSHNNSPLWNEFPGKNNGEDYNGIVINKELYSGSDKSLDAFSRVDASETGELINMFPSINGVSLIIQAKKWISTDNYLRNGLIINIPNIETIKKLDNNSYGITGIGNVGPFFNIAGVNESVPTGYRVGDAKINMGIVGSNTNDDGFYYRGEQIFSLYNYFIATKVDKEYVIKGYGSIEEAESCLWEIIDPLSEAGSSSRRGRTPIGGTRRKRTKNSKKPKSRRHKIKKNKRIYKGYKQLL